MACDSPNRYASISLELRAASVVLSLKFRRQIGVRPEFSDRTARKPRDIPDDMTLDSFEMVEDGIARVQIKHQVPAAVWLLWGKAVGRPSLTNDPIELRRILGSIVRDED